MGLFSKLFGKKEPKKKPQIPPQTVYVEPPWYKMQYVPNGEMSVDKTRISYSFEQYSAAYYERRKVQKHKDPLIAVAEFLFAKGFVFCSALASDGIDEITYTGDKAYSARYTDFADFRDNFEADMAKEQTREYELSGGWISSLNYGKLTIYLRRKDMRVNASVEDNTVRVQWYDVSNADDLLYVQVNEVVLKALGKSVTMVQELCLKYNSGKIPRKDDLSNWDIPSETTC